jgi:hypothetical protein
LSRKKTPDISFRHGIFKGGALASVPSPAEAEPVNVVAHPARQAC